MKAERKPRILWNTGSNRSAGDQVAQPFEKTEEPLALVGNRKERLLYVTITLVDMTDHDSVK